MWKQHVRNANTMEQLGLEALQNQDPLLAKGYLEEAGRSWREAAGACNGRLRSAWYRFWAWNAKAMAGRVVIGADSGNVDIVPPGGRV